MSSNRSLWHMTLGDFRGAIESRSMPGCGAAAAASAGIGLALVLKGLRMTEAKRPDGERAALIEQADELLVQLGAYADEDVEAFNDYLSALKQPHDSHAQTAARDKALAAATERINRVPLDTARACLDALVLSHRSLSLTADNLQSDTRAGAWLLHAGLSAVLLNVDANLSGLRDAQARDQLAHVRCELQAEADRALERLTEEHPHDSL